MAEHSAVNRRVVGSSPTSGAKFIKYLQNLLSEIPSNCFGRLHWRIKTLDGPARQTHALHSRRPSLKYCGGVRVDRAHHVLFDDLHIHVAGRRDARVP